MKNILVTGGAGFIGSHTCVELLQNGYDICVADNFSNSSPAALDAVRTITGRDFPSYCCDLLDEEHLGQIFEEQKIDAVIHFAGLKAVGESVQKPVLYYRNNVTGTLNLLQQMERHSVRRLVFSSSATVYGENNPIPYREDMPTGQTTNPYGTTKAMIEQILQDLCKSDSQWNTMLLRYFNPIGAHPSGLIGENPNGIPNNLMPYIMRVAQGSLPYLNVFGNDYPTCDGTGVRDYIHVCDLAIGHVKALDALFAQEGNSVYNLGTGHGSSVLEVVKAFEQESGVPVPYRFAPRRAGDLPEYYADATKAQKILGWQARYTLADMCRDSWNFIQKQGIEKKEAGDSE
ncbi:UDP-glucose 4-epimerase GalE [Faecalispora anaeroviscerum]|uniref:UDP-glucose 4-epimerase GalE n=1 Tax=Faecalispora anaeroviscerum TaxID=2991836 RepID=UPI0024BA54E2|nr:UDP-glucose 4-epimerase GalE [Faecalispora anaeroviscerum]